MNTLKLFAISSILVLSLAACGDDDGVTPTPDGPGGDHADAATTPDGGGGNPPAPVIGDPIDRMGRPAVATATVHTFDPNPTTKTAAKDAYNQNDDPSSWGAAFGAQIVESIAIIDGLDTVCGNQLAHSAETGYAALAGVLADDRLWLNTANAGTCTAYLAVEANALGVLENDDCGGRFMTYDVIATSYSVLAAGAIGGVNDTILANDVEFGESFPFLAEPHAQ